MVPSLNELKSNFHAALEAFDIKPNQANYTNLLNAIRLWGDAKRPKPSWETNNNGKTSVLMLDGKEFARVESKTVFSHLYLRGEKTSQLFRSRTNALEAAADAWMEARMLQVDYLEPPEFNGKKIDNFREIALNEADGYKECAISS